MNPTKRALLELKRLAAESGKNIYRRVELAVAVLGDVDWIATEHGGSQENAEKAMTSEFFADLRGYVSLGRLRDLHRHVPREKWEELRCDLAAVDAFERESHKPAYGGCPRSPSRSWKEVATEQKSDLEKKQAEILRLRAELARVTQENQRLRRRVEELERSAKNVKAPSSAGAER